MCKTTAIAEIIKCGTELRVCMKIVMMNNYRIIMVIKAPRQIKGKKNYQQ
jgi:hypothetical protein